jgi:hypothetical protein
LGRDRSAPIEEENVMRTRSLARWTVLAALLSAACTAKPPAECVPSLDVCNGLDDDCDGQVDEGFGVGNPCTVGQGACQVSGHLVCAPDGLSAVCDVTARAPTAETCNGVDDDCDGEVDEGLIGCCTPGERRPCGAAADTGVCRAGTETCGADWAWPGQCLDADGAPVVFPGERTEICNGLDDDCDGQVDEGFNVGQPCSAGVGACFAAGQMACAADGLSTACSAVAGQPTAEVCNGVDDDCDGVVDPEGTAGCTPYWLDADGDGYGSGSPRCLCAPVGAWTATVGGDCNDANAAIHPGQPERCNGIDDDCNGLVDEGFDVGGWCSNGLGACQRWGQKVCSADGSRADCPAIAGIPSAETCNGIDDDCDGATDEGDLVDLCGTVPAGNHAQPDVLSCSGKYTPRCVLACDAGWYDMDAAVSNGCECQPDADDLAGRGNDCNAPISLGTLLPGQVLEHTGTIVPDTDADHFVFTASPDAVGTYVWPTPGGGYGWWICIRLDPAYQSRVGMKVNGTGGTPIPICEPTNDSWGSGMTCMNNPNNQVRTYNIKLDRYWSAPMSCKQETGKETAFYRLQVKGYATEPVYPYPW